MQKNIPLCMRVTLKMIHPCLSRHMAVLKTSFPFWQVARCYILDWDHLKAEIERLLTGLLRHKSNTKRCFLNKCDFLEADPSV